ncbi:MAG: phosphate ABC transporter substrate-binding protein, PhoT family [Bacteroidia bacterium]|nr:MAG: phosphate ABC transporter substrate-binding protein, PhoT family [Bacteroidia bacterium]
MKLTKVYQNFIIIASRSFLPKSLSIVRIMSRNNLRSGMALLNLGILFMITSCNSGGPKEMKETPTRGNIRISVDESFQPIIDTEVYTFTSLYQNAMVKPEYKPEFDVVNDFMDDSVKVMVTSRRLSENQIQYLKEQLIVVRTVTFAYDALALITNKANLDTLITYNNVRDIFRGQVKNWKDIDGKSKLDKISVIFDNTKSGNIRYFKELFEITDTLGSNFFAVKSNSEVIDYVSRNPEAMGIVSVNWISDSDDSLSRVFVNKVNVLAIAQQFVNDGSFYRPYQGSIAEKSYPFIREVYMTSRETFTGLGSGFIQWATGEQGQRIVLKSGLVPATMPIRLVQVKTE